MNTSFKRISLWSLVVIVDRVQQSAHDQVQHRNAMTNPDAHRLWSSTETRLRFEGSAAERESLAAESNRVIDHCLKQTEVDRKIRVGFAIESDVVADGRLAVFDGRDEPQQRIVFPQDGELHVVAELCSQCWQERNGQRHESQR